MNECFHVSETLPWPGTRTPGRRVCFGRETQTPAKTNSVSEGLVFATQNKLWPAECRRQTNPGLGSLFLQKKQVLSRQGGGNKQTPAANAWFLLGKTNSDHRSLLFGVETNVPGLSLLFILVLANRERERIESIERVGFARLNKL